MHPARVRTLSNVPVGSGAIVYWMIREHRVQDNWAMVHAQHLAEKYHQPLYVVCCVRSNLKAHAGTARLIDFMFAGLQEVEKKLHWLNIPFFFLLSSESPEREIAAFVHKYQIGAIVTEASPLTEQKKWKTELSHTVHIPIIEVDTRNVIPVWEASDKREYGAYTLRPKLHKKLDMFLDEFPVIKKQHAESQDVQSAIDWVGIRSKIKLDESVSLPPDIHSGATAAMRQLDDFIDTRIQTYSSSRNDPNAGATSRLSAYLHFGQVSAQRIILELKKRKISPHVSESFIEELVIRRELAENFCFYTPDYKNVSCFPDWAQKTLHEHRDDPRSYRYSAEQLETAQTHDDLWNAAQMQMVVTGYMHGYLRMYWAKKILEWSIDAQQAMNVAIALNDKYELDGRDPNGYVGIAWAIGGVHDRPWFERPIFGKIRYMNDKGSQKKFDVKAYIQTWLH